MAIETVDALHKYGPTGVYALLMRKEFVAAADLLRKVTGLDNAWPASVGELTVAIFYALARGRWIRGKNPEAEEEFHRINKTEKYNDGDKYYGENGKKINKIYSKKGVKTEMHEIHINNGKNDVNELQNAVAFTQKTPDQQHSSLKHNKFIIDDESDSRPLWHDCKDVSPGTNACKSSNCYPIAQSIYEDAIEGSTTRSVEDFLCGNEIHNGIEISNDDQPDFSEKSIRSMSVGVNIKDDIRKESIQDSNDEKMKMNTASPTILSPHHKNSKNPNIHKKDEGVCYPVPDSTLESLLIYAPLALHFIYLESPTDIQLLASQQGWTLLYADLHKEKEKIPGSAVFVHTGYKIACLTIRGTTTVGDIVTDIQASPVPFPIKGKDYRQFTDEGDESNEENGMVPSSGSWTSVSCDKASVGLTTHGMAESASIIFGEHVDILEGLARLGYLIRLVGHSMGGSVAALVGLLLQRHFEHIEKSDGESYRQERGSITKNGFVRVYTFGSPSFINDHLAKNMESFVISVILHDDILPRLTPTSIRVLLKHLLYIRETWVKKHLESDLQAVASRAKRIWGPRRRGRCMPNSDDACTVKKTKENMGEKIGSYDGGTITKKSMNLLEENDDIHYNFSYNECYDIECDIYNDNAEYKYSESDQNDESITMASDYTSTRKYENIFDKKFSTKSVDIKSDCTEANLKSLPPSVAFEETAVILDEASYPQLYVPGKIVHIYTRNGGYKAALVPRNFRDLRQISLAGNMLSDHKSQSYLDAILEVKSVRCASRPLPLWENFDISEVCACCNNPFTWASTSNSRAQEARDKHNCRACGRLVCDPCSKNRMPLLEMGVVLPQRTCDSCFHNLSFRAGGEAGKHWELSRSYLNDGL